MGASPVQPWAGRPCHERSAPSCYFLASATILSLNLAGSLRNFFWQSSQQKPTPLPSKSETTFTSTSSPETGHLVLMATGVLAASSGFFSSGFLSAGFASATFFSSAFFSSGFLSAGLASGFFSSGFLSAGAASALMLAANFLGSF